MKVVKLSHPNYEYDVHSLVKAFYAEDQVTVITPETKPEKLAELEPQVSLEIELAETGAKIRVGEEDFLWDAETENLADGYKNGLKRFLYRTLSKVTGQKLPWGTLPASVPRRSPTVCWMRAEVMQRFWISWSRAITSAKRRHFWESILRRESGIC